MDIARENIQVRPKFVSSIHINPSVTHLAKHMLQHVFKHPTPFSNKHNLFQFQRNLPEKYRTIENITKKITNA